MQTHPKGRQSLARTRHPHIDTDRMLDNRERRGPRRHPLTSADIGTIPITLDRRSHGQGCTRSSLVRNVLPSLRGVNPPSMVGPVLNRTDEYLNTQSFVKDLERALMQSGQIQFVADTGQRQEVRQERPDQTSNARAGTEKPPGQVSGADFMLQGTINTLVDELDSTKMLFYQVDLELLDIAVMSRSGRDR